MFAHTLSIRVKLEVFSEFARIFEPKFVPLLRPQKGFRDEIVLAGPGIKRCPGVESLGDSEHADACHNSAYKDALLLAGTVKANPRVGSPDVLHATLYKRNPAIRV